MGAYSNWGRGRKGKKNSTGYLHRWFVFVQEEQKRPSTKFTGDSNGREKSLRNIIWDGWLMYKEGYNPDEGFQC